MSPKQAENLRVLIRHMETSVSRTLNMERYHTCGTPACAIGEAACLPHFQEQGLGLHSGLGGLLNYRGDCGHGLASVELFGLREPERDRIFGASERNVWKNGQVSPQEWAVEARKVLMERGYSMDDAPPKLDAFAAFMAKVQEPVALEEPKRQTVGELVDEVKKLLRD